MLLKIKETDCQIFLDRKQAEKYKEAKEKEFPIRWGGEYNHCKLIKKAFVISRDDSRGSQSGL